MALPAIPNHVAGFQAMIQSSFGTAGTLTPATDGMYPDLGDGLPPAPWALNYLFDGARGRSVKSMLPLPMVPPAGKAGETTFKTWFKGAGTAYSSAAILPPNEVHLPLQASGFDATFSTNKWVYTLTAPGTAPKFLTYGYYVMGKSYLLRDVFADWSYTIDGVGLPSHTFAMKGVMAANPATLTLPTITYPYESVLPPVAKAVTMSIGTWVAPIASKGSFNLGREFGSPRGRVTETDGHMSWYPTGFKPKMMFTVEQTALQTTPFYNSSGLDPDALRQAATGLTVAQGMGTSPNKWGVSITNAQCSNVTPAADGAIGMWDLEFTISSDSVITVTLD